MKFVGFTPRMSPLWRTKGKQFVLLGLAGAVFFLLQLKTSMSSTPWTDEVMQVDPGVNLYLGNGWTSSAWPSQSQDDFWAGNNPLYPALIYLWISVFGFSAIVVRSLNYCLAIVVTWLIVDAASRLGFLKTFWSRAVLASLVIFNGALTFVYRSGRADLVTMLVVILLMRVYFCVNRSDRRPILLFGVGTLLVPSGLQSIPFVATLLCLDYVIRRKWCSRDIAFIILGAVVGGISLSFVFFVNHSLTTFLSQTVASGYNIVGALLQAAVMQDTVSVGRLLLILNDLSPFSVLKTIGHDHSVIPLILFLVCVAVIPRSVGQATARFSALLGLIATIAIPYAMLASGRYAYYYSWMGGIPVVLLFVITLERICRERRKALLILGVFASVCSMALGLPYILWKNISEVNPESYSVIEGIVQQDTKSREVVYGDPIVYYAVKQTNRRFISSSYAGGRGYPQMSIQETAGVLTVIVEPENVSKTITRFGGKWILVRRYPNPYRALVVLRRKRECASEMP